MANDLGPAMQALPVATRNFVLALVRGPWNLTRAYLETHPESTYETANSHSTVLVHSPKVIAALQEEGRKRMDGGVFTAIDTVMQVIKDPGAEAKDRLKAAAMIMNRTGFHELTEHKVTVTRMLSDAEAALEIVFLAKELGMDPREALGPNVAMPRLPKPDPLDVEYAEIEPEAVFVEAADVEEDDECNGYAVASEIE